MRNHRKFGAIAVAASLAMQYSALATPTVITINDQLPGPAPTGPANENNETEPGNLLGQAWDLEAMVWDNATKDLTIVAGYNFSSGATFNRRSYHPGDIYLDIDGLNPLPSNDGDPANVYKLRAGSFGYDFVIHFKNRTGMPVGSPNAVGTMSADVEFGKLTDLEYELIDLRTGGNNWDVFYNENGESNLFVYEEGSGGTVLGSTGSPGVQTAYATDLALNTAFAGVDGWTGTTATGWLGDEKHYTLTLNLDDLAAVLGASLDEAKFTIGCGNDMIRGDFTKGNIGVPDGGSTLMLLGGGMCILSLAGCRMRKS